MFRTAFLRSSRRRGRKKGVVSTPFILSYHSANFFTDEKDLEQMSYAILRTTKIKTNGNIAASLSHNYRDRETHNADETKAHLNSHDHISNDAAFEAIQNRLPEKVRKDGVRCIEYMITASPDFFENNNCITQDKYFESAKEWLIQRHGLENVITTSIHRDETSPHLIAYVVPYVFNEKKQKENLNCKHFLGGRKTLSDMQTNFHKHVSHFGLERGVERSIAKHQTVKEFYSKIQNPIKELKEIAASIIILDTTFLESKEKYAGRVADSVWNQACDYFEDTILKTTNKNYSDLYSENCRLNNEIKVIKASEVRVKRDLNNFKKSMEVANRINTLPLNEIKKINSYINKKTEEIAEKNVINPIKEKENIISFRWDKENSNYYILINEQRINKKVPVNFINEIQKNSSFLRQFTKKEIYNDHLKGGTEMPATLVVDCNGTKTRTLERELGISCSFSM